MEPIRLDYPEIQTTFAWLGRASEKFTVNAWQMDGTCMFRTTDKKRIHEFTMPCDDKIINGLFTWHYNEDEVVLCRKSDVQQYDFSGIQIKHRRLGLYNLNDYPDKHPYVILSLMMQDGTCANINYINDATLLRYIDSMEVFANGSPIRFSGCGGKYVALVNPMTITIPAWI